MSERGGFYRQELNKTVWEVPQRYQNLTPVGSGAYGSVCSKSIEEFVSRGCVLAQFIDISLFPISMLQALCSAFFGKNRPRNQSETRAASSQPETPALFPQRPLAPIVLTSWSQSLLVSRACNA